MKQHLLKTAKLQLLKATEELWGKCHSEYCDYYDDCKCDVAPVYYRLREVLRILDEIPTNEGPALIPKDKGR